MPKHKRLTITIFFYAFCAMLFLKRKNIMSEHMIRQNSELTAKRETFSGQLTHGQPHGLLQGLRCITFSCQLVIQRYRRHWIYVRFKQNIRHLVVTLHFNRIIDFLQFSIIRRALVSSDFNNLSNTEHFPTRKKTLVLPKTNSFSHPMNSNSTLQNIFGSTFTSSGGKNGLNLLHKSVKYIRDG